MQYGEFLGDFGNGISQKFVLHLFDLLTIPGQTRGELVAEDLFVGLAEKGVVLIPANLFFSEELRAERDYRSFARGSLPNVTFSNLQKGAKLIKEYMTA
ncbi:hypothetical protein JKY72_02340 [Candidatus Gracilibacteria bacterium]|nr:hypothetical protein [Candidatus Gracilibacteria bacterium]